MSNYYWDQTALSQAISSTNNDRNQSSYYWGYPGYTINSYYGSYPWIGGAGSAIFPVYASSTLYPSSSSTLQAEQETEGPSVSVNSSDQSQTLAAFGEEGKVPSSIVSSDQAASLLVAPPSEGSRVAESRERFEPIPDSPRLASLDFKEISANEAVFCFGVLAIQSLLLPRFQYSKDPIDKKWGCILTMYGHTIVKPHLFDSQETAKAETCREALKTLVSHFPEWIVPREPEKDPVAFVGWNWVELLQDYCVHNGLLKPHYI